MQCDVEMMKRVFLNLATNVGQALDGGALLVETSRVGARARIVFHDTGPGISSEVMARLFSPFVTSRAQGTGLGLAIARKIVESHYGTIEAANVTPHGAEFVIDLPL